jgi:hypothetical protein
MKKNKCGISGKSGVNLDIFPGLCYTKKGYECVRRSK